MYKRSIIICKASKLLFVCNCIVLGMIALVWLVGERGETYKTLLQARDVSVAAYQIPTTDGLQFLNAKDFIHEIEEEELMSDDEMDDLHKKYHKESAIALRRILNGDHITPLKHPEMPHKILDKSLEYEEKPEAPYSIEDLNERMKFQKEAMKTFCAAFSSANDSLQEGVREYELFKHLLYDDDKKLIFCYVPKVGCSNWKRLFVVLNGILPPTESSNRPPEQILRQANKLAYLKPEEREWRLKEYFKFSMLRNPLERIISAYRNKVTEPLDYVMRYSFPYKEILFMLRKFESNLLEDWLKTNKTSDIHPKFLSFLHYLSTVPRVHLNEHFRPFMELCHPCTINYDLYTNFKYLPDDPNRVMDMFQIPHHYYLNHAAHPQLPTADIVDLFMADMDHNEREDRAEKMGIDAANLPRESIPRSVIRDLLLAWEDELELYYALFPEERNQHLKYL